MPASPQPEAGQVITFYSYKGGTGRTMALANIGYLLAIRQASGKPVLMIDWDLEAPGLHRYFSERMVRRFGTGESVQQKIDDHPGLLDLFAAIGKWLKQQPGTPIKADCASSLFSAIGLDQYIIQTDIDALRLIKAGAFGPAYSSAVNTFDWEDIFRLAPWLFTELALELSRRFSYVLIDSRTGLTDVSGVCTMLMPEKLVLVFTPNRQSLYGALDLARTATRYRRKSNDLRPLVIYPLPSRVERAVPELLKQWRLSPSGKIRGYQPEFEALITELYSVPSASLSDYFDAVQIPHVPEYAYGEEVASMQQSSTDVASSAMNYGLFLERLLRPTAPWQDAHALEAKEFETDIVRKAEEIHARFSPELQEMGKRAFERLVRLARPDEGGEDSYLVVHRSDLHPGSDPVLNAYAEAGLLSFGISDPEATVKIAQESLIKAWPRLRQWIEQDRAFLLWRQSLRAGIAAWEQNKRQTSYLLSGAQLLEAENHLGARKSDLNGQESAFIAQSRTQYNTTLALSLSSYATHELARPSAPDSIPRAVLLAAESLKRAHTIEGDQALRQGLSRLSKPLHIFNHGSELQDVLLSHTGEYLATRGADFTIRLWRVGPGTLLAAWPRNASVQVWCFSPDDRLFGWLTGRASLEIRSTADGMQVGALESPLPVRAIALSDTLAAVAFQEFVYLYAPENLTTPVGGFPFPNAESLAFFKNGATVAAAAEGGVVLYSSAEEKSVAFTAVRVSGVAGGDGYALGIGAKGQLYTFGLGGMLNQVENSAVSVLSSRAAASIGERAIQMWDGLLGKETSKIRLEAKINGVSMNADGALLATAGSDGIVRLFDTSNGQELQRAFHEEPVMQTSLDGAGRLLAARTGSSKQAYLWDVSREAPILRLAAGGFAWDVCFDSTGARLATASNDGEVRIYSIPEGKLLFTLPDAGTRVTSVAFSFDDRLLAVAGGDNLVRTFDAASRQQLAQYPHDSSTAVAFSPLGHLLASVGRDGNAICWDLRSNSPVFEVEHTLPVWHTAFNADGTRLATACDDGIARIIDTTSGKSVREFPCQAPVRAVAFQPNREVLASAGLDGYVRLFDMNTGSEMARIYRQTELTSVAFTPDGDFIASGGADDGAQILRLGDTSPFCSMSHPDSVNWLTFSPDGRYLATACSDGFVRVCTWRADDLIEEARLRARRILTREEWSKYLPEEPYPENI